MTVSSTLFAWATPAFFEGSPVDHTWVTNYDNRVDSHRNIQEVVRSGALYWFCWGDFHSRGGAPQSADGLLRSTPGDAGLAQCLVKPNADSSIDSGGCGVIFDYGFDGVCHQLANQVLYAAVKSGQPVTVEGARGYTASVFLYGQYGHQQSAWLHRIASCGAPTPEGARLLWERGAMVGRSDDFETRARAVLGERDPDVLNRLLALRGEVRQFTAQRSPGVMPASAETLNARNQNLLDQAAALLGPDRFMEIFGYDPAEKLNLVDPQLRQSLRSRPRAVQ